MQTFWWLQVREVRRGTMRRSGLTFPEHGRSIYSVSLLGSSGERRARSGVLLAVFSLLALIAIVPGTSSAAASSQVTDESSYEVSGDLAPVVATCSAHRDALVDIAETEDPDGDGDVWDSSSRNVDGVHLHHRHSTETNVNTAVAVPFRARVFSSRAPPSRS